MTLEERKLISEFENMESYVSRYAVVMMDEIQIKQDEDGNMFYTQDEWGTTEDGCECVKKIELTEVEALNLFLSKYANASGAVQNPEIYLNRAMFRKDLEKILNENIVKKNGTLAKPDVILVHKKTYKSKEIEVALKDDVKFEKICQYVEKQLREKVDVVISVKK